MRVLLFGFARFFVCAGMVRGQSSSGTWIDVTASPYTLSPQLGKTVTTDGTNCFVH